MTGPNNYFQSSSVQCEALNCLDKIRKAEDLINLLAPVITFLEREKEIYIYIFKQCCICSRYIATLFGYTYTCFFFSNYFPI